MTEPVYYIEGALFVPYGQNFPDIEDHQPGDEIVTSNGAVWELREWHTGDLQWRHAERIIDWQDHPELVADQADVRFANLTDYIANQRRSASEAAEDESIRRESRNVVLLTVVASVVAGAAAVALGAPWWPLLVGGLLIGWSTGPFLRDLR